MRWPSPPSACCSFLWGTSEEIAGLQDCRIAERKGNKDEREKDEGTRAKGTRAKEEQLRYARRSFIPRSGDAEKIGNSPLPSETRRRGSPHCRIRRIQPELAFVRPVKSQAQPRGIPRVRTRARAGAAVVADEPGA